MTIFGHCDNVLNNKEIYKAEYNTWRSSRSQNQPRSALR